MNHFTIEQFLLQSKMSILEKDILSIIFLQQNDCSTLDLKMEEWTQAPFLHFLPTSNILFIQIDESLLNCKYKIQSRQLRIGEWKQYKVEINTKRNHHIQLSDLLCHVFCTAHLSGQGKQYSIFNQVSFSLEKSRK